LKRIYIIFYLLLIIVSVSAQTKNGFNYQAVVRDASGQIIADQQVSFLISIIQDTLSGDVVYSEEFTPVTNMYGLVNLAIGSADPESFNLIDWSQKPYFIRVELDPEGGYNYTLSGTSELLSVPYAMYAEKAGNQDETDPVFQEWYNSQGITDLTGQLTEINQDVESLQREIDKTQVGAGLTIYGNYYPFPVASYINKAINLYGADVILDKQLKETTDSLGQEISDRENADAALQSKISNDSTYLKNLIDTETANRISADSVIYSEMDSDSTYLKDLIDQEILDRETAVATLQNKSSSDSTYLKNLIDTETANRIAADNAIKAEMDSDSTYLKDLIDQEISDRETTVADLENKSSSDSTYLKNLIDTEATNRIAADNAIKTEMDSDSTYIKGLIDQEILNRETAVSNEASARTAADAALQSKIGSDSTYLKNLIDTEITNRISTDHSIKTEMDSDSTYLKGLIDQNTALLSATPGTSSASKAVVLDASKNISGLNNVDATKVTAGNIQTNGYFYFGDQNTDGTWRMYPTDEGLVFECRESGSWVVKMTILK